MRVHHVPTVLLLAALATASVCHAESEKEVLTDNHTITLVITEDGKAQEFSHVFAGTRIHVMFAKGRVNLTGKLDPTESGRMLFSYTLTVDDWYEEDGKRKFVQSGCDKGKVYLEPGRQIDVFKEADRSFALLLSKPKNK